MTSIAVVAVHFHIIFIFLLNKKYIYHIYGTIIGDVENSIHEMMKIIDSYKPNNDIL
jgi:hypothetical protein